MVATPQRHNNHYRPGTAMGYGLIQVILLGQPTCFFIFEIVVVLGKFSVRNVQSKVMGVF